ARDLGHTTHQYGTDIDIYHFYTFPGAISGADNYAKLRSDAILAIQTTSTDPTIQQAIAARQRVIGCVSKTRTGLDNLAANETVSQLLYALGSAGGGLSRGWARDLLTSGQTTVSGQTLNLGLQTWSNSKYIPRNDHNDHIHIALDRALLGE